MNTVMLLGFVAGTLTTIAFLPQLFKTWKSRSAKDISLEWLITFTTGILLWLIYGFCIASTPVILANGVTLVLTSVILFFKLKFD
ncbi:SemiSWEET transporter [Oscillatoria sp. FACHB-1407]|uniref:SemiSWEET transporter n=1 Tax=Oscillatoria sp. FACHB-1407 TaxID=2692847 RepID=UPI001685DAAF|nr:SemiSWEET transporter [Oscillatoria sp. FACHB-1407]MBD2463332.1 SemiSWEET transporter [Oscillatoria sp. FACHB-1407]